MAAASVDVRPVEDRLLELGLGSKVKDDYMMTSSKILNIIYRYRLTKALDAHDKWSEGTPKFLAVISKFVKAGKTVRMCLPAFPFKSANKTFKVLDGLVYNDLLTIPDRDVWAYGEELRAISAKRCEHIEFSRLKDLVSLPLPAELEEVTYIANATNFRRALLNKFARDDLDVSQEIAEKEDTRLTYCGYTRFLENDLQYIFPRSTSRSGKKYKKDVKLLAKEMIARGYAFAAAVKENFPDYLRLSIHQSTGQNKISISLLPTDTSYSTPWHCSVAFTAGGNLTSGPKGDFETDPRFELIWEAGRPSFFREKSARSL
ncbi:hypothetical protein MMC18_000573 [Xylographa bjoerkii]|nr:hypothetical protein [Xylographa bjoerkii]